MAKRTDYRALTTDDLVDEALAEAVRLEYQDKRLAAMTRELANRLKERTEAYHRDVPRHGEMYQ